MKKLKLSLQNMEGVEVLTREQLKKVMGGDGGSGAVCLDDGKRCSFTTKCCNECRPTGFCGPKS